MYNCMKLIYRKLSIELGGGGLLFPSTLERSLLERGDKRFLKYEHIFYGNMIFIFRESAPSILSS